MKWGKVTYLDLSEMDSLDMDDAKNTKMILMETFGYILDEDKDVLRVIKEYDVYGVGKNNQVITIPKILVKKIRYSR